MCYYIYHVNFTIFLSSSRTAHERSHQKMDDKEDKLKWPWERIANDELSDIQESPRRDSSPDRLEIIRKE